MNTGLRAESIMDAPVKRTVRTRGDLRKIAASHGENESLPGGGAAHCSTVEPEGQASNSGKSVKSEGYRHVKDLSKTLFVTPPPLPMEARTSVKARSTRSDRSSHSFVLAQKKKLEYEAAQRKAQIQMELLDKKLAAELAAIEAKYSDDGDRSSGAPDIEQWLERSQLELEKQGPDNGANKEGPLLPPDEAGTDGSPVQKLTCAIKELQVTQSLANVQNNNLLSRISTPRDLPSFYGEPLEWLAFKQAYEESTLLCNYTEKENAWRLRRCLRGPARETVSALLMSFAPADKVMSTLELQYGNPDVIATRIMSDLKKLHPVGAEYHKDIVPFSIKVNNYVASVRALRRDEHLQGVTIVNIVLAKLPTVLVSKWADYSYPLIKEGSKCRLDILSDFLSEEAVKISTCSASLLNVRTDYKRKYNDFVEPNNMQTVLYQSELPKEQTQDKCRYCRIQKHKLTDCKKFKKSLRKDRWAYVKRTGLCFKCLLSHHDKQTCPAAPCDTCGEAHHRLLHYVPRSRNSTNVTVQLPEEEPASESLRHDRDVTETVTHIKSMNCTVLLKVVQVNIHGPNGIFCVYALLDDGSTVSLISSALAQRAGFRGERHSLRVKGAWDDTELVCETELVDITLSNKHGTMYNIRARSVNELNLPVQNLTYVNSVNYSYLSDLTDELCTGYLKPELLIGQDNFELLLPLETRVGSATTPCATLTPLGWCLHGRTSGLHGASGTALSPQSMLYLDTNGQESMCSLTCLHEEVRRSFELESMGVSAYQPRKNADEQQAWEHLEKTSTLVDGKWYVGLPWKDVNCVMPDTYSTALVRLRGVEQKMNKSQPYAERYIERIRHLLDNNYAEELPACDVTPPPKTWYLPHFGVDNVNKKKLRLVFDAAAKTNGLSLNDYLLTGPDLLNSLFGIMLRFRENKIAVTADIKDMFLRVKIQKEDRDALRFIFRGNPTEKSVTCDDQQTKYLNRNENNQIRTYVMSSLIFGANCSPFVAQFVKNKNAQRFEATMPSAAEAIHTQHYMDDYIDSLPDERTAKKLVEEIMYIHSQGNFELRNWNSNYPAILGSLPQESLGDMDVRFKVGQQHHGERTLGLIWHPHDDSLSFDVSFKKIPTDLTNGKRRPTKREMLRVVMSIFDVYGLLSPITIIGKMLLQETWLAKISWDDPIPDDTYSKWQQWIDLIHQVRDIKIPRFYEKAAVRVSETTIQPLTESARESIVASPPRATTRSTAPPPPSSPSNDAPDTSTRYRNLQMHMFCDASMKAFCAVAYWRWINIYNEVQVAFIASKCRVAGNKAITVPRLELQAAVLAARLAATICKEHKMKPEKRYFWSDSTTVLHWIRNESRNYKIYVANRLGEIDELTQINEWRYVPTKINVADIATRECYDCTVLQHEWLYGPNFLLLSEDNWPHDAVNPEMVLHTLECVATATAVGTAAATAAAIVNPGTETEKFFILIPNPGNFSSWIKLKITTLKILTYFTQKWLRVLKIKCKDREFANNYGEWDIEKIERLLLVYAQQEHFTEEINLLRKCKNIPTTSKLLTLSPYLDEHGVLRAGGRIDAALDVSPATKRPAILDGKSLITRLIVRHYHVAAAHGNQELVVNEIKQSYWIIKIRPTVRNVVKSCMLCRLSKCKPEVPRMGDLPAARVAHHQRPFTFCGLDLFGPMEVTVGRRRERRYAVLFTCMTVRAIHIEVVHNLTTDSLIMALRRMAARRGWPQQLFSDNGTNLKGADTEMKKSIHALDKQTLEDSALTHGTKWTFIPPASPHWGGAWERLIRSVKTSLNVVLRERAPRDETLCTHLAEVENIVNSRPLSHVSVEPGSMETITPNHFLIGSSSNLPQMGIFDDSEMYLRKQWRIAQRLTDLYWHRWVREILPTMIPRSKWNREARPLQVGDLVYIADPEGPRNLWRKGIIEEVFAGKDGRIRTAKIKTRSGVLARSASRIARVPLDEEC